MTVLGPLELVEEASEVEVRAALRPGVRTAWENSTGGVGSIDD